jgi:hypothetical protein
MQPRAVIYGAGGHLWAPVKAVEHECERAEKSMLETCSTKDVSKRGGTVGLKSHLLVRLRQNVRRGWPGLDQREAPVNGRVA